MLDAIKSRKALLSRTIDRLAEKIASLPEGSILIKHHNGTSHFIYYKGNSGGSSAGCHNGLFHIPVA